MLYLITVNTFQYTSSPSPDIYVVYPPLQLPLPLTSIQGKKTQTTASFWVRPKQFSIFKVLSSNVSFTNKMSLNIVVFFLAWRNSMKKFFSEWWAWHSLAGDFQGSLEELFKQRTGRYIHFNLQEQMALKKVTLLQVMTLWAWSHEAGINWPVVTFVPLLNQDWISFAGIALWSSVWVRLLCPVLCPKGDMVITSISSSKKKSKDLNGWQ